MSKEIEVAISSFSQERLWFIHQLEPTDTAYNMMTALRVSGRLQVRALLSSFKEIVRRHEILRTTFALDQDENALLQLIQPVADVNVVVVDLRSAPGADKHSTVAALIQEERGHCFNPRKGPLLRIRLLLLDQKTNVLLVNMHHIISDGWSTGIFIRELGILYRSFTTDAQGAPPLNELAIQYGDYAEWQREHLNAAQIQHLLDYWKTQITGIPERLELPTDRTASPNPSSRGGDHVFKLDPGVVSQIKANTNQSDITPFMVFLTIFGVQLARYSGRDNLVIGSPIAGRGRRELEPLIGFFVNTLALRVDLSGNPGYRELVNRVRRTAIEAYAHQELPFEKLVEALAPRGNTNRASFFQVFFTVQNTPTESLHFPGLSLTPLEMGPSSTQFDLVLNVNDASPSPEAGFTYRTDLFDPQTIMRMGRHFCALLEEIAAHPDMAVFDLSFVAKDERRLLLVELNKESTVQRPSNWIHRIVEGHASKIPDHPAIRFDGGLLTFKELNRESDQWCARLRAVGVAPGKPVGLLLENCPEMAAVLLGILKAGGFYVPLDPALPNTRLSRMLKDSGALLVVTERALASVIPVADHGPIRILFIDEGREKDSPHPLSGPDRTVDGAQLAYLIFTSGSTGTPKGVAVTHQGLADYIAWGVNTHSLERGVGVPFHAPLSFDASVPVLWAPLAAGCPIWPIPQSLGIEALASLVFSEKHFSLVNLTPAHLEMLFQSRPHSSAVIHTDYLVLGGEAMNASILEYGRLLAPNARIFNEYGPTEIVVGCCTYEVPKDFRAERVPIGRPTSGAAAFVLDRRLRLLPIGVPGELCIGGQSLSRGYLNMAAATAEKFVPNPFASNRLSDQGGSRLYRTGDRARWLAEGQLQFMGRLDFQLKLRGFRIEPGEIEAMLRRNPSIREAVVLLREDKPGNRRLVAYVVPDNASDLRTDAISSLLAKELPSYMIPESVVVMPRFPLTAHGKLDRTALPLPDHDPVDAGGRQAPRNPVEARLVRLWSEVLDKGPMSVKSDFFALGGHSLLATRLASRVQRDFGVSLPLKTLFASPTIEKLSAYIMEKRGDKLSQRPPIQPSRSNRRPPLSFAQQRMWFLQQVNKSDIAFNMPFSLELRGYLSVWTLQKAVNTLLERHESPRTIFPVEEGQPYQKVLPYRPINLPLIDLRNLERNAMATELSRLIAVEARHRFDLAEGPLLRIQLLCAEPGRHVLCINMHHIVCDGWSIGIFNHELAYLYLRYLRNPKYATDLPPLPVQYRDFAVWQRSWLQGEILDSQLDYWTRQLSGSPNHLDLPSDYRTAADKKVGGGHVSLRLEPELNPLLAAYARQRGATLFMVLVAGYQVLLSRYSGQEDLVIGAPIAGRNHMEVEPLIGCFLNTLPIRCDLSGDPDFNTLLDQVQRVTLGAYERQDLPLERIIEALPLGRDAGQMPLFQAMFLLQNAPVGSLALEGLEVEPIDSGVESTRSDLFMTLTESEEGLLVQVSYDAGLFHEKTIAQLIRHYGILIQGLIERPEQPISSHSLLSEKERESLVKPRPPVQDEPPGFGVHQLFEQCAAENPDAPAILFESQRVSRGDLNQRANRLAYMLIQRNLEPGAPVAVMLQSGPDQIVALLAVLKTGAAFVCLDPDYPRPRLERVLDEANPRAMITDSVCSDMHDSLVGRYRAETDKCLILFDSESDPLNDRGGRGIENPDIPYNPDGLVYVVYTSGSTGRPKGIAQTHRAFSQFLHCCRRRFPLEPDQPRALWASLAYDAAYEEIFNALCFGSPLAMISSAEKADPDSVFHWLREHQIALFPVVPGFLDQMLRRLQVRGPVALPHLRHVLVAGEPLRPRVAAAWLHYFPDASLYNLYGPTESILATCHHVREVDARQTAIPIGKPLDGREILILDAASNPCPTNIKGEIYIRSRYLTSGYFGRTEETERAYLQNPLHQDYEDRVFKTGDLGRWSWNGEIEIFGRTDNMVKIRGKRVELEEIEAVLVGLPHVVECVVQVHRFDDDDQRLFAYAVSASSSADASVLLRALRERLPGHMIPAGIVFMEKLPRTPNGKLNRRALPPPDPDTDRKSGVKTPPRNPMERNVAAIWENVLGLSEVSVRDNFFELGGHSYLLLRLMADVERVCRRKLPLSFFFEHETIEEQARELDRPPSENKKTTVIIPLRKKGRGPTLFWVHPIEGRISAYIELANELARPFMAIQAPGLEPGQTSLDSVEEMAAVYLDSIRKLLPEGPYYLGGWSFGGVVAWEMARLLREKGESVPFLALLDSLRPEPEPGKSSQAQLLVSMFAEPDQRRIEHLLQLDETTRMEALLPWAIDNGLLSEGAGIEEMRLQWRVFESHARAFHAHTPGPLKGPVLFLEAERGIEARPPRNKAWRRLANKTEFQCLTVPGDHFTMLRPPRVRTTAKIIGRYLDEIHKEKP